jgi:hypothetical protein
MPSFNSTARRSLNSQIGQPSPEFLELFSRKSGSGLLDAGGCPPRLASPAPAARIIDVCLCIFGRVNVFVAVVQEARAYSSDGKQRSIDILRKAIYTLEDETAGAVARLWLLLKLK